MTAADSPPGAGREALAEAARLETARVYGGLQREAPRRRKGEFSMNDLYVSTTDTPAVIVERRRVLREIAGVELVSDDTAIAVGSAS